jgi:hypothetical protein
LRTSEHVQQMREGAVARGRSGPLSDLQDGHQGRLENIQVLGS